MSSQDNKYYFNQLAPKWDKMVSHNENKIQVILQLTGLKQNSKILDIATGTGILIKLLKNYHPKKLVAIDISNKMIEIAQEKYNFENLEFINTDFYKFNQNNFDFAICYSAYPHFLEKEKFIQKLYKSLNIGGRFVIAHSDGKEIINNRHKEKNMEKINTPLKKIEEEAKLFKNLFNIDILVDTNEFYILSGTKKAE